MFDKIIEYLLNIIENLLPIIVIKEYDKGVRLRFGKYRDVLEKGIHFKIPFFDEVLIQMTVTTTMPLPEQTITTLDQKNILVKSVIKYEISDVKKLVIDVSDAKDAISDMTQGIIRTVLIKKNWSECNNEEIEKDITKKARSEADKWGIKIEKVTFTSLGIVRTLHIVGLLPTNAND